MNDPGEVTVLLQLAETGDAEAANRLFRLVEQDLKGIAIRRKQAAPQVSISTTALVDEIFCKLVGQQLTQWQSGDRRKFYGYASRQMHNLLIDAARKRFAEKRGGHVRHEVLDEKLAPASREPSQETLDLLIDLREKLALLQEFSPDDANIFRIRYFFGATFAEIANVLEKPQTSVERGYQRAKRWLQRELKEHAPNDT